MLMFPETLGNLGSPCLVCQLNFGSKKNFLAFLGISWHVRNWCIVWSSGFLVDLLAARMQDRFFLRAFACDFTVESDQFAKNKERIAEPDSN